LQTNEGEDVARDLRVNRPLWNARAINGPAAPFPPLRFDRQRRAQPKKKKPGYSQRLE
jgi:hypothetical protein